MAIWPGQAGGHHRGPGPPDPFFQDRLAGAAAGAAAAQGNGAVALAGGACPAQGGAAPAGNFAAGQVKSINGNDLEISTATEVTKVKLTDKTQIQKTVSGTPSDIKTGERVPLSKVARALMAPSKPAASSSAPVASAGRAAHQGRAANDVLAGHRR